MSNTRVFMLVHGTVLVYTLGTVSLCLCPCVFMGLCLCVGLCVGLGWRAACKQVPTC